MGQKISGQDWGQELGKILIKVSAANGLSAAIPR